MISDLKSPFKMREDSEKQSKNCKTNTYNGGGNVKLNKSSVAVGLRILVQISQKESSHLIVKQVFRPISSTFRPQKKSIEQSCFLKLCHLCYNKLSPHKDVYMYRGDQGYCSIECRNRQIIIDETKELEASTKQMLASTRHCYSNGKRKTPIGLEEHHRRYNRPQYQKRPALIFDIIAL